MFETILIYGVCVVTRSLGVVCMSLRFLLFCISITHWLAVATLSHSTLLGKFLILDFTDPHCFVMLTSIVRIMNNARRQIVFPVEMRCLNNLYCSVTYLMFGVLIYRSISCLFWFCLYPSSC